MAIQTPNFTSAPNVGPEPPGLMDAVKQKIFGQGAPEPSDPYALDNPALLKILTDTRSYCEPGRELFEYGWWRNILYTLGRQWIYWNPTSRQWQDKRLAKWVPKPVTNIIRTAILSVRSTLQAIDPGISAMPVGSDPKNVAAAQTADDLEPLIAGEHKMGDVMLEADFWAITLGTAFLHTFWDKDDTTNMQSVPQWKCQLCGTVSTSDEVVQAQQRCPSCGSMALMEQPPTMQPVGRGRTLAVSPLELMLPLYAQKWDQVDRLIYLTWRPKHELEDEYGPEITKGLNYDTGPQQRSLQLYKSIATTSDLMLTPSVWNTGAFTGQVQGATEQHVWIKPCKSFPQGFYQRYLGESTPVPIKLTDKPVIPFTKRDGTPLWPWIHYPYESFGGRLYAQSIVDSIVQKQDQINQIDSMSQLVVQRMGNPIWREEKGQEVERFTGEPGLILRWQRTGPNSQPPDRIAGENQPQSWGQIRGEYKTDAEELSGTYDVLKGARPTGVEAYSALQLLVDRSQSRFTTLFKARARAYRDWYACAIELERQHGPTQRVQALLGPNHGWTFQTFERVDLDGDIDIHLEDGTATPKTALGRRAALEHANQLGLVQAGDSEQRYKMLQELGLSDLAPSLDADVQSALQEQDAFEQWAAAGFPQQTPNPLIRYPWDSDEVHVLENRKWMNGDAIRMLLQQYSQNPQMKAYIVQLLAQHLEEHQQALEAQQLPTSPGAPAGGPGGGAPAPGPGTKGVGGVGAARSMKNAADARVHPAGNVPAPTAAP